MLRRLRLFVLKQRIQSLSSDILLAESRRTMALGAVASLDAWSNAAHRRLRMLKAQAALLERADVLLAQAVRHD